MGRLTDGSADPHSRSWRHRVLPLQRTAQEQAGDALEVRTETVFDAGLALSPGLDPAGAPDSAESADPMESAEPAAAVSEAAERFRREAVRRARAVPGAPFIAVTLASVVFAIVAWLMPHALPWATALIFVLIGLTMMRPLYLLLDALGVGSVVAVILTLAGRPVWNGLSIALVLVGTMVLGLVLQRDRDAVIGAIGGAAAADAMLIDLRERIQRRRQPPALPPAWLLEIDLRAARGDGFCGDFVVTATEPGRRLAVALVDVSGQGSAAGARAVLLSGAMEALLNAVPPARFLPAANDHVLRIGDEEGFATAVHASIDLVSGEYSIMGAGHPPAVHYRAGSGRWQVLEADQGPALGLLHGPAFPAIEGVLARGDLLLLFTDGLVENRHLDVTRGIDRLVGHAEAVTARGGLELASAIAEAIRAEDGDDRALVLIRHI